MLPQTKKFSRGGDENSFTSFVDFAKQPQNVAAAQNFPFRSPQTT